MTPTKVSQSGYAPLDNDEERKDRSYRTDVKNSASPQMSSGRKRGRSRENKGFKISFVDESFFVVARPWKSLAFQQSKDTIGRYLYWGLPLYVLCSTVFVGYSQFATTGTSQLDIEDNNRDVLNSNVKDYSNIDNVRMTFDSGATLLGLIVGWGSLVVPHLLHGLILIMWFLPMENSFRGHGLFVMSQLCKMVWAGTVNAGIAVIAFMINVEVNAPEIGEKVSLMLFQTQTKLAYVQIADYILMIMLVHWLLRRHREAIQLDLQDAVLHLPDQSYTGGLLPKVLEGDNENEDGAEHDAQKVQVPEQKGWEEETTSPEYAAVNPLIAGRQEEEEEESQGESTSSLAQCCLVMRSLKWSDAFGWRRVKANSGPYGRWRQRVIFWGFLAFACLSMGMAVAAARSTFATIHLQGLASALAPTDDKDVILWNFPHDGSRKLGNEAMINFTQSLFTWLYLVAPGLVGVAVIMFWILPIPRSLQLSALYLVEVLSGWSCLELWFFTASISLTSLRILCDSLLADIELCETLAKTGTVCFSVNSEFTSDTWWMILAAILHRVMIFVFISRTKILLTEEVHVTFTPSKSRTPARSVASRREVTFAVSPIQEVVHDT
mmetsp:Transcript_12734/g.17786  ORF Transcript_12734/g.17786 Transcript_12734/m.17786 type:complete len:607 (+) Transcript_12734:108-1928(+)